MTLKTSGRSVMVELNPDFGDSETVDLKVGTTSESDIVQAFTPASETSTSHRSFSESGRPSDNVVHAFPQATETSAGDQAEGVKVVREALRKATNARWPMYVRNVKQIIRAADSSFDERRFGFGGIMDLLRACQRDGLIRMERDRRGGLRVFPGATLQRGSSTPAVSHDDLPQDEQIIDTTPGAPTYETPLIPVEAEPIIDVEPQPVDTTAELLGRAKQRRPRARAASASGGAKKKRPAAAKRGARSKKAAAAEDDDNIGNQ